MSAAGLMPEDFDDPIEEVEGRFFSEARERLLPLEAGEHITWVVIGLSGRAPDTRLVLLFAPRAYPHKVYGLTLGLWPMPGREPGEDLAYFDIQVQAFLADGVGADARLGQLEVDEGLIRWLTPPT